MKKTIKGSFALGRHKEGICLNDIEFVLNKKGTILKFKSVSEAKRFILSKGLAEEDFGYSVFAYNLKTNSII